MAPGSSIATRNAARNAITDAEIIQIEDAEFSGEVARRWKHSIVAASKNVPTKIAGAAGAHGHTYLLETCLAFNRRAGKNPRPATNPGALNYTTGVVPEARSITMAQERENHEVNLEAFHTQEVMIEQFYSVGIGALV